MNERIVVHPPKKDKKGKYYVTVSYYINDIRKQKRKSGFARSGDAKKAGEKIRQHLKDTMPVLKATGSNTNTLRSFSEEYIQLRKDWAPGTIKIRKRALAVCDFVDKKLSDITKMDIAKNVSRLEASYAWNTIDTYVSSWLVFLNAAEEYEYLAKAPKYKYAIIDDEDEEEVAENVMAYEDALEMINKIEDRNVYLVSLIGLTTGARRGEIADINMHDIDLTTGLWHIRHQWKYMPGGYKRNQKLKTKNSYREVPLPPSTLAAIKAYPHRTIDGFVFNKVGLKNLIESVNGVYTEMGYDITMHGLRHSYVTNLIRSKEFDLQSIAKMAGDTIQTILKTYVHYLDEMKQENIEKIAELFG